MYTHRYVFKENKKKNKSNATACGRVQRTRKKSAEPWIKTDKHYNANGIIIVFGHM